MRSLRTTPRKEPWLTATKERPCAATMTQHRNKYIKFWKKKKMESLKRESNTDIHTPPRVKQPVS